MEWPHWLLVWWLIGCISILTAYILSNKGKYPFTVGDIFFTVIVGFCGLVITSWPLWVLYKKCGLGVKVSKFLGKEIYNPGKEKDNGIN